MAMLATKAFELVKEYHRSETAALPPFDENALRQIFDEMAALDTQNRFENDTTLLGEHFIPTWERPGVRLRHAALERNRQCVLAYLTHRLGRIRDMRWTTGGVIPERTRLDMTEREIAYFKTYSKSLAKYMNVVGGDLENGLDLTQEMKPPKSGCTCVKVLKDWELDDGETGEVIVLKQEAILFMDDNQCDSLVRQGIVERVNSAQER